MGLPKSVSITICSISAAISAITAVKIAIVYKLADFFVFSILPLASFILGIAMLLAPIEVVQAIGLGTDFSSAEIILRLTGALLTLYASGTNAVRLSGCPVRKGIHNFIAALVVGAQAYFLYEAGNSIYLKVGIVAGAMLFVSIMNLSVPLVNSKITTCREPPQTVYSKSYLGPGYGSW
mmetsp:Transcript_21107/g.27710  ORF Transcript_21107/g.27710 Transcript_21107/m.27710 type:complete len:179 (-) Transcript_21107:97-633(-)